MFEMYDAFLAKKKIFLINEITNKNNEINLFSPYVLNGTSIEEKILKLVEYMDKITSNEKTSFENIKDYASECIDYFEGEEVIGWYQRKSKKPRKLYRLLNTLIIIGNAMIASILLISSNLNLNMIFSGAGISANDFGTLLAIFISLFIAVFSSLSSFFDYNGTWRNFKKTQFKIEEEIRKFRLKIVETENIIEYPERSEKLISDTENFLNKVYEIHNSELDTFFDWKKRSKQGIEEIKAANNVYKSLGK